jgi:hypothetical protein
MASEDQRTQAAEVRKVLKNAWERGEKSGEERGYEAGLKYAMRQALLKTHAEALEAAAKRVDDEPATTGFKEAASILRDLAAQGPPEEPESKVIERKAG